MLRNLFFFLFQPVQMVFMDSRDYMNQKVRSLVAEYSKFLYAIPMTNIRVFCEVLSVVSYPLLLFITKFLFLINWNSLQDTCLASKDVMSSDLLKKKLC